MLALPAFNPVQGAIDHLPQGSNLGPPSQQVVQPSASSSMPNPPMTSKVATGYASSSVPVKKAAAAGYGSGRIPRTRIKAKSSKPHVKPTAPAGPGTGRTPQRTRIRTKSKRPEVKPGSYKKPGTVKEVPIRGSGR